MTLRSTIAIAALASACEPVADRVSDTDPPRVDSDATSPDTDAFPPGGSPDSPPDAEYVLRLPEGSPSPLELDLDRAQVEALFGSVAEDITLLTLDTRPLVRASLDTVKRACGTAWESDVRNPVYDCTLTELGRTFSGPDGTWRTSPEFSLIRILTMTPANADVDGTSVAALAGIADFLQLGGGFGQILADSLQIGRTTEFLETDVLSEAFVTHVAGPHPATGPDGSIDITLADALDDLRPLAARFGPTGGHPGLIDPAQPTFGEVFTDAFRMVATVRSNLRVLEGIDLDQGKEYVGVVVDSTGPTFDDEVEFDFTDPSRFRVEGIAANLTVDLRLVTREDDAFVPACTNTAGRDCTANLPSSPLPGPFLWGRSTTTIEYVIGSAALDRYGSTDSRLCYLGCLVEVRIGQAGDPAGFVRFGGLAQLLAPPPQYAWELLNELAQVRLHANGFGTLAEGAADVAFDLRDIPIGITGPEAAEAIRPVLQGQRSLVSDFLLGDFRKNNAPVDVFWRRTEDGRPTLFFIDRSDLPDGARYGWTRPGFFADRAAEQQVGRTEIVGVADAVHYKWQPPTGEAHVHLVDDGGRVYRLDTFLEDASDPRAPLVVEVRQVSP